VSAIDNPANCEIYAIIHIFHTNNMSTMEIHRELCMVYGLNIVSERTIRQWYRMFKDGLSDVHNKEWSGQQAIWCDDDLVQSVDHKVQNFHVSVSRTVLYEAITVKLGYFKFVQDVFQKMLMCAHKMQRTALSLTFF
jgi:hypothetical protein